MNMNANIPIIEQVSAELRDYLGDDFDPATFWDTLDGEVDVLDIIDQLIDRNRDAAAHEAAIKAQIDELSARKGRFADRQRAAKAAMFRVLDATGEKKVERPGATLSRRPGSLSVSIDDERLIPSQLTKTKVEPDKAAIKAQLQAGEDVPGASLQRGPDGITLRVV